MLTEDAETRKRAKGARSLSARDKVAFSLPETAKILGRSVRWARQKTASGKLKSVRSARRGASLAQSSSQPFSRASKNKAVGAGERSTAHGTTKTP